MKTLTKRITAKALTRRITATAVGLTLAVGMTAAPAQAHIPSPAYKASIAKQINTDTGKPSQWSERLSPKPVRTALDQGWARKKMDTSTMERRIHAWAKKYRAPLSEARDFHTCIYIYGTWTTRGQDCLDRVSAAYNNYPSVRFYYLKTANGLKKIAR